MIKPETTVPTTKRIEQLIRLIERSVGLENSKSILSILQKGNANVSIISKLEMIGNKLIRIDALYFLLLIAYKITRMKKILNVVIIINTQRPNKAN